MSGLERYRVEREIGRGAMGVVYWAWDTTLERAVALKELVPPDGVSPDVRDDLVGRFLREARAAARLQHPNVVQVFDVFSEGERQFIAMELLEGASLAELLDNGGLQPAVARQVLMQTLDAVQAAHDAGIVHRDLKPDNIYLLEDGRVKVTDFGIAKVLDAPSATSATQIGTIIGTPGYMSPEQVQGLPVDARSDIFALGVLGCELYTGHNPFLANSPTATLYRIVNEPPHAISELPADVAPVIARAMEKDPARRYGCAAEMAAALRGDATTLRTISPAVLSQTRRGNSKIIVAVSAVGALLVLGLLAAAIGGGVGGSPDAQAPAKSTDQAVVPAATPSMPAPEPEAKSESEPEPAVEPEFDSGFEDDGSYYVPFWGVFIYANADRMDAESEAQRLQDFGYPALVLDTAMYGTIGKPGQSIWVVCAGPYATKVEADGVADELKSLSWPSAYAKQVDY